MNRQVDEALSSDDWLLEHVDDDEGGEQDAAHLDLVQSLG